MTAQITTMNRPRGTRWKAALEAKLNSLSTARQERDELVIEQLADPVDQVQSSNDRDMAVLRLNQDNRLWNEVRSALSKLDDGTFGICEDCAEEIPQRRLDAIPWARLCVGCQSKAEYRETSAELYDAA